MRTTRLKLLLLFVLVMQFGYPVTQYGTVATTLYMLGYAGMLVYGILACHEDHQPIWLTSVLAALVVVFGGWVAFDPHRAAALAGMYTAAGLFLARLFVALLRFIFEERSRSGKDLILAAVTAYLVLGGVFVAVFGLTETLQPGSFIDTIRPDVPVTWQTLIYYSYVTMATLGYGEILPVGEWARAEAILHTVAGTLFIATIIARLVGLYASRPVPGRVVEPEGTST